MWPGVEWASWGASRRGFRSFRALKCSPTPRTARGSGGMAKRYKRLDEGCGLGAVGRGSFGRVYAALDRETQTTVAVKRQGLPSESASKELCFYKALSQEAHPHVMTLLDHFVDGGTSGESASSQGGLASSQGGFLYMVFDFMDTTLWRIWEGRRRLVPLELARRFSAQLASGVAHLHDRAVVHADLSMQNMLVGGGDVLRIADMGGAANAADMVLRPGEVITTLYARAPEVLLGARRLSVAIDLWAIGIASCALLTGSLLFWRPAGLEPRVPGLAASDEVDPGGSAPKRGGRGAEEAVLANMAAFLGALSETKWPGGVATPGFAAKKRLLQQEGLRASPGEFLADKALVRRPTSPEDAGSRFAQAFLVWDPDARLRAKAAEEHPYLNKPLEAPSLAAAVVAAMDVDRLRQAVLTSVTSGKAITPETLVAMSEPPGGTSRRCQLAAPVPGLDANIGFEPSVAKTSAKRAEAPAPKDTGASPSGGEPPLRRRRCTSKRPDPALGPLDALVPVGLEPRLTEQREEGPAAKMCMCRGNCGMRACTAAKNRRHRSGVEGPLCLRVPEGPHTLCPFCRCERCQRPRMSGFAGDGRWCHGCAVKVQGEGLRAKARSSYPNSWGTHRFDPTWSAELKLTAQYAFATNLSASSETSRWSAFLEGFCRHRGLELRDLQRPGDWMLLIVVACVKWEPVVHEALRLLEGLEPRTAGPEEWRAWMVRMVHWAHGSSWRDLHRGTSPRRIGMSFGLVWFFKKLGVVERAGSEPSRQRRFCLGAMQQDYVLGDAESCHHNIAEAMRAIEETALRVPVVRARSQVEAYGRSVHALTGKLVSVGSEYARGTLGRILLDLAERAGGADLWDEVPMMTLGQWLPDANGHCAPLDGWTGREVRARFAMSPLEVSKLACMWGMAKKAHLDVLATSSARDVINAVADCGEGGFEPSVGQAASSQGESRRAQRASADRRPPQPAEWVAYLWRNAQQ